MSQNTLVIPTSRKKSNSINRAQYGSMISTPAKATRETNNTLSNRRPQHTPQPRRLQANIGNLMQSLVNAIMILAVATLATVALSDITGIHHRLMDVAAQHEKADAKLQLRSCVYQRNPDLHIFTNKTEVQLIQRAGFSECDEASAFVNTVFWRYLSAITSTYSVCDSLSNCRDYLWSWAMYAGGFLLITWSSWHWVLPALLHFAMSRFGQANYEPPRYHRQIQNPQPIITDIDEEWEDNHTI
jgi:hypothetical protein